MGKNKFITTLLSMALIVTSFSVLVVKAEDEIVNEEPQETIEEIEEPTEQLQEEIVEEEVIEDIEENTEEIVEEETTSEEIEEEPLVEEVPVEEEIIIEEIVEEVEVVKEIAKATSTNETPKKAGKYAKIKNTEASINGFVVRLYRNVLNREPDDGGFDYWTKGIKNKSITGSTAVKGFFLSKEITNKKLSNEDFVKLLYLTVLNRNADKAGLKYWVDHLNVKMTRESVINGFINSKEFGDLCKKYKVNRGTSGTTKNYRDKSYNVTAFVSRMYTKALKRNSDISGLEYWCKKLLDKSATGADLVVGFFFSEEFKSKKLNNTEFVKTAYRTILDREGEASGVKYWVNKLNKGASKLEVLKGFVESKEFTDLCSKYGITRGYINLYTNDKSPIGYLNASVPAGQLSGINGFSPSSAAYNELLGAIRELEAQGIKLSVVMMDIQSGKGVMYNPDTVIYSASSIKAPYVISLVESNSSVYPVEKEVISRLFYNSNNEDYSYLAGKYGLSSLERYYNDIGVPYDIIPSRSIYTHYSGRTYAKLWARMYQAFNSDANANAAGSYLESNCCTAFRDATGLRARSKSGWYSGNGIVSQNEGGVAYVSNGDYIYVVLSTHAGKWQTFYRIHRALNALHNEIR